MWKVRELVDKATNVVMNYSEVEAKVREATNEDAWGPHGSMMQDIAQYTFTYEHFPEVMGMLWKRMLHENKKNWRRVYKSLLLLNYLVRNGSERVVTSAREHIYDLRSLETYTFTDEFGKDQGINIRQKTKDLVELIQDDERLRDERKKAKKNKDKYIGVASSDGLSSRYKDTTWNEDPITPTQVSGGQLEDIDEWNLNGKKTVAEEAIGKVKDLWNKTRKLDDAPEYSNDDELFDEDPSPNKISEFKDDEEEFTTVERIQTTTTEKITAGRKRATASKKIDLGQAVIGLSKESDSQSLSSKNSADLVSTPSDIDKKDNFILDFDFQNANGDFASFSQADGIADFADFSSFSSQPTQTTDEFDDFISSNSNNDLLESILDNPLIIPNNSSGTIPQTLGANISPLSFQQPQTFNTIPVQNTMYSLPVMQGQPPTMQSQQQIGITANHSMNINYQQNTLFMPQQPVVGMMQSNNLVPQFQNMTPNTTQGVTSNGPVSLQTNPNNFMPFPNYTGHNLSQNNSVNPCMFPISSNQNYSNMGPMMDLKSNTWSNTNLNINLDNLSPANQFKKSSGPSINQLQMGLPINSAAYPHNQINSLSNSIGAISLSQNNANNKSTIF